MSKPRLSLSSASEAFRGRYLREILEVVVLVGDEQYALPDTAVFVFDDGMLQVSVDVHEKVCCPLASLDGVTICGDYEDRTGVNFRALNAPTMFNVTRVFGLWEGATSNVGGGNLVGLLFADADAKLVLGMNAHLDDLICGRPEILWRYINAILPSSGSISVREFVAEFQHQ